MSKGISTSSIGRKLLMALSGFFLMVFITTFSNKYVLGITPKDLFNEVSHFMGTNAVVQFVLQPILLFGVLFHFRYGNLSRYKK